MVLVCHPHRFIYMKTHKTASTSVEMYFERWCMPEAARSGSEAVAETVSALGVVGSRRTGKKTGDTWVNHMPAARVRALLGEETWARYFKFTTVRNPFAQVLSNFFWLKHRSKPADDGEFAAARRDFARFVRGWPLIGRRWSNDLDIVGIDGTVAMDRLVRFERLAEELPEVCAGLGLPWQPEAMVVTKRARGDGRRYATADYYTPELVAIVRREFDWLFSRVDYHLAA
jgi:Sulfotransferase family